VTAAPVTDPRVCAYCRLELPAGTRPQARTCGDRCRQALSRGRRQAVDWASRGHRTPDELYRLQLARRDDAPPPMRVAGSAFWACRCGQLLSTPTCTFCGGTRPAKLLLELDLGW
jgi:hypothetical protein